MSIPETDRNGVQVISRAVQILKALREEPDGASLSQISDRTGLARSTVHRLVGALEAERFVVSVSRNGSYRLGPAFATYAEAARLNIALDVRPIMVKLSRGLNETVDLSVLDHDHVLFVDQVAASTQRLRAVSAVGAVFPAHSTACGKALLAQLPDETVMQLLKGRLERITPHTIASVDVLVEELAEVRESGVAYDREEQTLGICAVGTAIVAPSGRAIAMSIPVPTQRFEGNEQAMAKALLTAKRESERHLKVTA